MQRLLALGERKLDGDERIRLLIGKGLESLSPSVVFSDLAPGWNLYVAEEAQNKIIPTYGVFPHAEVLGIKTYKTFRQAAYKATKTKIVFNDTLYSYLKNPEPYVTWLIENVDVVLAYVDESRSSMSHSLMVLLKNRGKKIFNVFTTG